MVAWCPGPCFKLSTSILVTLSAQPRVAKVSRGSQSLGGRDRLCFVIYSSARARAVTEGRGPSLRAPASLWDDAEFLADLVEGLDAVVDLLGRVSGRELAADPRLAFRDDGEREAHDKHALLEPAGQPRRFLLPRGKRRKKKRKAKTTRSREKVRDARTAGDMASDISEASLASPSMTGTIGWLRSPESSNPAAVMPSRKRCVLARIVSTSDESCSSISKT